MTEHPGQDRSEDGEETPSRETPNEMDGDTPEAGDQTGGQAAGSGGHRPTEPIAPGYGQPTQSPYGQPTSGAHQAQSAASASSGYGYSQQSGGYPPQGQPGPGGPQYGGQPQSGQGGPPYGGQPQPYQQHPYPQQPQQRNSVEGKNFFAALFDLSFQSFVTVKFAKFIYVILMVFIALGYLVAVISAFTEGPVAGLLVLLLGWIPAAIYLILIRITLEFMIAMVRTSQNTAGVRVEMEQLRGELRSRR
ncbi:DUF4282 domain-containing protein [Nesterenkonia lutea]|uniref:Uncharacterized membrane protein (DUF485 family) n=1 Tax=Nesterenkonia lutea TaxID=272919 RepID=A0ABR9JG77_9MICC|nr:DUF4282 domain-containing protein [Nesterenkonia lutea]MBE1524943.1 uncharacterized membrane protein (DUF485 family) [Nesterenkonia lutea]